MSLFIIVSVYIPIEIMSPKSHRRKSSKGYTIDLILSDSEVDGKAKDSQLFQSERYTNSPGNIQILCSLISIFEILTIYNIWIMISIADELMVINELDHFNAF